MFAVYICTTPCLLPLLLPVYPDPMNINNKVDDRSKRPQPH